MFPKRSAEVEEGRTTSPTSRPGSPSTCTNSGASTGPYVFYTGLFLLFCLWPVVAFAAFVAIPFTLPFILGRLVYNIFRAADWNLLQALKLTYAASSHLWGTLQVLPMMITVAWYYYVKSSTDGVRRNIPFAVCPCISPSSSTSRLGRLTPTPSAKNLLGRNAFAGLSATGDSAIADCRLDVYMPEGDQEKPKKVLVFIYGGAWCTGSKMYYSKLAALIRITCDVVVVVPDYPTYPKAAMPTMVDTLFHVMRWVNGNIAKYGGDPNQIFLAGHSAGAHLAMCLTVRRALALSNDEPSPMPSTCTVQKEYRTPVPLFGLAQVAKPMNSLSSQIDYRQCPGIAGVIVFSGVFDLTYHLAFEHRRGVDRVSAMDGATMGFWDGMSPTTVLNTVSVATTETSTPRSRTSDNESIHSRSSAQDGDDHQPAKELARHRHRQSSLSIDPLFMPYVTIVHAAGDTVVDVNQSMGLRDALRRHKVPCSSVQLLPTGHAEVVLGPVQHAASGGRMHPTIATIAGAMHS